MKRAAISVIIGIFSESGKSMACWLPLGCLRVEENSVVKVLKSKVDEQFSVNLDNSGNTEVHVSTNMEQEGGEEGVNHA